MSGETERGTRFARDLRRIRRDRGISLADIHDATKIAYDIIKRFEHDALINHPQFNRVYLRLFVRAYAEHLGLDVQMTLEALELAIKGRYAGSLAKEYLGESEEERKEARPKQQKKTSRAKPAAPESDQVTEAAPSTQTERKPAKTPRKKSSGAARKTDAGTPDAGTPDSGTPDSGTPDAETSPTEQPVAREVSSPEGVSDRSASPGARPSKGGSISDPTWKFLGAQAPSGSGSGSGADPRWIFLGVLVVVVGLGVWALTRMGSGPDELVQESPLPVELVEPANDIPIQSLPDTLNITIVADKGGVAPIRVTLDDDLRRPYWIDRGGSMTFRMVDRIILEQQLDSVTVLVEGMTYPVSRPAGEDIVTLTRDAARSWFSSIQR